MKAHLEKGDGSLATLLTVVVSYPEFVVIIVKQTNLNLTPNFSEPRLFTNLMKFDLYKYIIQPLIAEFIKPTLDRYCRARKK